MYHRLSKPGKKMGTVHTTCQFENGSAIMVEMHTKTSKAP